MLISTSIGRPQNSRLLEPEVPLITPSDSKAQNARVCGSLKLQTEANNGPDSQRSYLDRHHAQIRWLKQFILMPVLDRRAANRSSDALSIAVLGCSTGEESVRIFWELSTELAQRGNKPGIKICGVDLEKRVVTEARRRVSGAKPLQGSMNNDDSEYARDIINGINHDLSLKSALRESVEFREGDITKPDTLKEAIEKQPDIIFINHTFRLFDQGAQLKIYGALSATFRDAVIAIGDPEGVINNLVQEGGYEHLLVRPEIREGLTVYAFGLPFWTNQVIPGLWG